MALEGILLGCHAMNYQCNVKFRNLKNCVQIHLNGRTSILYNFMLRNQYYDVYGFFFREGLNNCGMIILKPK
jgi:hypothetical protein